MWRSAETLRAVSGCSPSRIETSLNKVRHKNHTSKKREDNLIPMERSIEQTTETEAPKAAKRCWFARWIRREKIPANPATFSGVAQAALDESDAEVKRIGGHGSMYRAGLTLAELKPGECGTVRRLFGPTQGRLRLLEMGVTPGTHIKTIRAAAFGGPLDILVRGYKLSLRLEEAAGVWLDDPDEDGEVAAPLPQASASERRGTKDV